MNPGESSKKELKLGAEVIQLLIPHRRPLLMIDAVVAYQASPQPTLWTRRHVSANEEVFAGHFPDLFLWPGIYTQEGLGQSCHLLQVIFFLQDEWTRRGKDPEEILRALRNLEMKFRLHPGYRPQNSAILREFDGGAARLGMAGSVEIRFYSPVFAGQCLEYRVTRTHSLEALSRFEIEAAVEGKVVAKGKMTGTVGAFGPENTTGP